MSYPIEKSRKFERRLWRAQRHGGHGRRAFAPGLSGVFRTGRRLGAADLQIVILALLKEKPRNGSEIIAALAERSRGFYSPGPAMVYPALTYLEELGHAQIQVDGAKKLYSITADGEARLKEDAAIADAILEQLANIGRRMERMREIFAGETADSERVQGLRVARRELRTLLREKRDATPEEQQRVAEILKHAAKEIRSAQA